MSYPSYRPPYCEPEEQPIPVAPRQHLIGVPRGLQFGIVPIPVHHQVRGAVEIHMREHHVFLSTLHKMRAVLEFH